MNPVGEAAAPAAESACVAAPGSSHVRIGFRPLETSDLPMLSRWFSQTHIAQWWHQPPDLDAVIAKYQPRIDRLEPTRMWVVEVDGRPAGLVQSYLHSDYPDHDATVGIPSAFGVDYLLDNAHCGRGVGTAVLRAFASFGFDVYPDTRFCVATPACDNPRSWRCLEAAGFTRRHECQPPDEPPAYAYALGRCELSRPPRARAVAGVLPGDLADLVRAKPLSFPLTTRIVAIDGPGGAGKSTLSHRVAGLLGGAAIVPLDDFGSWDEPLDWWPRAIEQLLEPLVEGRAGRYQRYDWDRRELGEWVDVPPAEFLVVEGVSASREAFARFLTFTIWVETSRSSRLVRGLARDGEHMRPQWETWMEQEDRYVEREHPADRVDLVVSGERGPQHDAA